MVSTKLQKTSAMHAAGIFADMTVDGPEIGTLVVIVDRAKNLPNKKTMGKQDPYCACRLAKEAKKTNTDKRGGQVPRWDQELRFTVRDSADYYNLKVSIFNDDKKTELIGEAWVDLGEVVKPGGGQSDIWHNLNCKGKYAGEVRLEMTYYDSRPKPEKPVQEAVEAARDVQGSSRNQTPVKRRPLPSDPTSATASPAEQTRPLPSAAGPREIGTPSRPLPQPMGRSTGTTPTSHRRTAPNTNLPQPVEPRPISQQHHYPETPDDPFMQEPQFQSRTNEAQNAFGGYEPKPPPPSQHQDYIYRNDPITGLPELPPMNNQRRHEHSRPQQEPSRNEYYQPIPPRQPELHHAHSAPQVPVQAPYPEDMMHPRDTFHHTQSDGYMNHGHPVREESHEQQYSARIDYDEPRHDVNHANYVHPTQPSPIPRSPVHEGYDHIPHDSIYRRSSDQYDSQAPAHYQPEPTTAPPPPPVHRESAPSSARRQSYSNYAPAPLNITPARRSPSPYMYDEPEQYEEPQARYQAQHEYRRNTAPSETSPHEPQIYRPRALSGEAMRNLNRPVSRDSRDGDYALPPSHPDYHSPTTGAAPAFPDPRDTPSRHRDSYQGYQPVNRSPLAVESPLSFRGDRSSLPSQQNTPSRMTDRYSTSPTKQATPPRPYSNHQYSASESYVASPSYQTPNRQHPLAQQLPHGSSPDAYPRPTPPQEQVPIVRPIALPPVTTPIDNSRQTRSFARVSPTARKSVSPRPPPSEQQRPPSSHFDPDSFNRFNPAAASSTSSLVNHPATSSHGSTPARDSPYTKEGKIVDFHGNHIDPSDRLPEASWAPEPEPKAATKEKPYRERERIGGARDLNVTLAPRASPRTSMGGPSTTPVDSPSATTIASGGGNVIRARLRKKERPSSAIIMSSSAPSSHDTRPFRDIPNPAGYSPDHNASPSWTTPHYGGGIYTASTGTSPLNTMKSSPNLGMSPSGYDASPRDLDYAPRYGNENAHSQAPPRPAKIPLSGGASAAGSPYARGNAYHRASAGAGGDDLNALAEEMRRIDIGAAASARGRVPRARMLGYN